MPTAEELTKAFLKTPEMREHDELIATVDRELDPEDTVTVELQIPKLFMTLMEFLERTEAEDEGRKPDDVTKALNLMLVNQLHELVHLHTVAPGQFPRYRNLWNRFCEAEGAPEHKIEDEDKEESSTDPF